MSVRNNQIAAGCITIFFIGLLIVGLIVVIVVRLDENSKCQSSGGEYVKTLSGYKCVEVVP